MCGSAPIRPDIETEAGSTVQRSSSGRAHCSESVRRFDAGGISGGATGIVQNDPPSLLQFVGEPVRELLPERLERSADVILHGLRSDVHDLGDFLVREPVAAV